MKIIQKIHNLINYFKCKKQIKHNSQSFNIDSDKYSFYSNSSLNFDIDINVTIINDEDLFMKKSFFIKNKIVDSDCSTIKDNISIVNDILDLY